jgi:putative hydrolase of the HAD superfamily
VIRAVLLDAMGTLVRLEPPVPRLHAALAAAGRPHPEPVVAAALRAEILHYRRGMHRGRDAAGLAELRRECAAVLAAHLDDPPAPGPMVEMLLDALRFAPYPEVPAALEAVAARGVPAVVVSNWDVSLPGHLRALGLGPYLAGCVVSAAVGAAKPDPAIFRAALGVARARPGDALHIGDDLERDLMGAMGAGLRALLLDREGRHDDVRPRIATLAEVVPLLRG